MKRNRLRWLLEVEQKKAGLLTRKGLLRDFQNARDEVIIISIDLIWLQLSQKVSIVLLVE